MTTRKTDIDDEYYKNLMKNCRVTAKIARRSELAEEFAVYAATRAFETQKRVNINWAYVDFLREEFGRFDTYKGKFKNSITKDYEPMTTELINNLAYEYNYADTNLYHICEEHGIVGRDRAFLILYYKYGFEYNEIGKLFGLSESLVWQDLDRVIYKLKTKIEPGDV